MPFSTYLGDPTPPTQVHSPQGDRQGVPSAGSSPTQQGHCSPQDQQNLHQSAEYNIGNPIFPIPTPVYSNYYVRSISSSSPLNAHSPNGAPGPSYMDSSPTTSTSRSCDNGEGMSKTYVPPSPSLNRAGSDGLFQMPAFLMGNLGGTLAPGGGAEVLTPGALGMFDLVSTSFASHPLFAPENDNNFGKRSWQSTKYNALRGRHESSDDVAVTTSAPVSASKSSEGHASGAVPASPFGYLNAESPRERAPGACVQQEADSLDNASRTSNDLVSIIESASAEPNAFRPQLYTPIRTSGLPVYSQSGFDMLSILGRVARRPNPTIVLGPVDLTCAFVVADVRRVDAPIVYASRTFCELTGYSEGEILGQNCRFLQAPGGHVARNELRRFTSSEAVCEMRFALDKDREVQVSLINYRKDGRPFANRVSIVPIPAEDGTSEIAFHVGFQVDLNEQPHLITKRIQDGQYYSAGTLGDPSYKAQTPRERSVRSMGKKFRDLLSDPGFQSAVPISTSCNSIPSAGGVSAVALNSGSNTTNASGANAKSTTTGKPDARDERQWLNLVLLEHMPDFVHVLSLKGHFLYVSPSITRVLGYTPEDLMGKSVGDFCHPSDAVPLLRELKESTGQICSPNSAEPIAPADSPREQLDTQAKKQTPVAQRTVDLLFRMRRKNGEYAWVESIGRLYVEASKGRKAIVLSGRMCAMPNLRWGAVSEAGGIGPITDAQAVLNDENTEQSELRQPPGSTEREFWAMLCEDGLFLVVGASVRNLLGWGTAEMIGRSIREFIIDDNSWSSNSVSAEQAIVALTGVYRAERGTQSLTCQMKNRGGGRVWMQVTLYANEEQTDSGRIIVQFKSISPPNPSYTALAAQQYPYLNTTCTSVASQSQMQSQDLFHYLTHDRPKAGRILHAPSTNVFAEFETHRGTSWQYELQQLKYANDKLRQQVNVVESRQRMQQRYQHQQLHTSQHQTPWIGNVQA